MNKQEELDKLKKEIEEDKSLPLRGGATHLVFGEGNPDAEIYFLGEAPGFHEDRLRRPFVGQAGKLLDRLIESIGAKREDVYISNIVRFRPPENRDPLPSEIKAFELYVDQEIQIIGPKLIVTLGRFSMNKFLPDAIISRVHGKPHNVKWHERDILIVPVYHPAAALRRAEIMEQIKEDFKAIPKVLEEMKKPKEEKVEQLKLT